jgi:hypothetical protein
MAKKIVSEFHHNYIRFTAKPRLNINIPAFCQNLVPYHQVTPEIQQALQRSLSASSPVLHNLRERQNKINYRALHLGKEIQQATQDLKE